MIAIKTDADLLAALCQIEENCTYKKTYAQSKRAGLNITQFEKESETFNHGYYKGMWDSYDEIYDTMLKLRGVVTSYLKRKQEKAKQ